MLRIGIFSGTFDPVHNGHIAFCRTALQACKLDQVVLIPEEVPRAKQLVTPLEHRLLMLALATQDDHKLSVTRLATPQFTVSQTLPELRRHFPGAELTLLLGSDVAKTFAYRWPQLEILLGQLELAIGLRHGDNPDAIAVLMRRLQETYGVPVRFTCLQSPHARAASSGVRSGHRNTVDPKVTDYIARNDLYASH